MTELAVYEPSHNGAVVALPDRTGHPGTQDFDSWVAVASDVIKLANVIFDTPFVPDDLRGSAPAVAAAILAGREMGLGPMTSLANIHVIKGKPGPNALLMRALVQARGHKWEDVDVSDTRVVIRGCRRGESHWLEVTFTAVQAKQAGIDLGKYPADKLYARASVRLARRKFADVVMGMPYSAEELEDGDFGADEDATMPEQPAIEAKAEPKPRTAQRRSRQTHVDQGEQGINLPAEQQTYTGPPDPTAAATSAASTTPATSSRGSDQPPLPGEDEPDSSDYDTPGTATREQLTALWATFTSDFEFTKDDKAEARKAVEKIIGRELDGGTTANLSRNEASMAVDTLKRCRTRGNLIALLATGEMPQDGTDG